MTPAHLARLSDAARQVIPRHCPHCFTVPADGLDMHLRFTCPVLTAKREGGRG